MVVIYRELTNDESELVKNDLLYWLAEEDIIDLQKEFEFIVGEGNWKEVYIVNKQTMNLLRNNNNVKPFSVGLGIGEIKGNELLISISGAMILAEQSKKKITISSKAEQLFLYKRNVLAKSIRTISFEYDLNDKALIMNEKGDCLGIGKMLLTSNDLENKEMYEKEAIRNLMDLGWYLRKGK